MLAGTRVFADEQVRPGAGAIDGIVATQHGTIVLGGAQVVVRDSASHDVATALSEADGKFHVGDLVPGKYTVVVTLPGFDIFMQPTSVSAGRPSELTVDLAIATLTDTIDVVAPASVVSSAETLSTSESVGGRETDQLAPGGGLQAALRLLASVIEVPSGVSIKGGRPTQAGMQIGSITLTDPAMGLVHLTLPDDAIDSVAVLPKPYAVEYGRFSSGLVLIRTRRASDQWKMRVNNLQPTFRSKRHEDLYNISGISGIAPQFETGGPVVRDRLYLEEAAQYRYSTDDVASRPESERRTTHWFSSFTRADAILSPRHSLVVTGGLFPSVTALASLGTFTPPDATVDVREHVNHASVSERALWRDTLVGETAVQVRGYDAQLSPQGTAPMVLSTEMTLGNFYNTQERMPTTVQAIETIAGSANLGRTGLHLFKVGLDVLYSRYDGTSVSRPVLMTRADGTLVRRLDFSGAASQSVRSADVALFAQDRMQPTPRWYLEYGARLDRDGIVDRWNATPRVGAAFLIDESGTSVLRGGYGLFYERTPSAAGAFTQFETTIDRRFDVDGVTPLGPAVPYVHVVGSPLRTARSATWDVAYDWRVNPRWSLQASLLERRGSHELIVEPLVSDGLGELRMGSDGRSKYRTVDVGVHYTRSANTDLSVTYARAVAESDLNAFANYFDTMMWPVIGANAYGVAGTDVPHRLLARGRMMPTSRWLLVAIANWRTGLPYSAFDAARDFVGVRDSLRMPNSMRLDLGVERRFHILHWQPWIGIRGYNALNTFLPADVQANIASPNFGGLYNSDFRQLRLQVRFER